VLALAAGADALCVGHDLHEETVDALVRTIGAAVSSGRLPLERLEEAAARVRATARWGSAPSAEGAPSREVGAEAARRAIRIGANARVDRAPLVVELVPEANVAAGELAHGLADVWPDAIGVRLGETSPDTEAALAAGRDRPLVLVTRDAGRHEWQQALAWELLSLRPDTVVVETGLPGGVPAAVETFGAGRANLEAAVAALAPYVGETESRTTSV
jgi:beta-N-acetylhexosaminidase